MVALDDDAWLDANLEPARARAQLGLALPDLPPPDVQHRFTGRQGRANLRQAFDFYRFVSERLPPAGAGGRYRVVDFGGGWGRILRLFLRELPAEQLLLLDCLSDAIECARALRPPYAVVQNDTAPPLPMTTASADCCYAFSVFSHLSEAACSDWFAELSRVLVPGGKLVITTRGRQQIRYLRRLRRREQLYAPLRTLLGRPIAPYTRTLLDALPPPDTIERHYNAGRFQFYPTGGGGELSEAFYGETWIPRAWLEDQLNVFGFDRCEFFTEFATIDQCVCVLTKPD